MKVMGKLDKLKMIRLDERTMMLLNEIASRLNVSASSFIRFVISKSIDYLLTDEGYIDENKIRKTKRGHDAKDW